MVVSFFQLIVFLIVSIGLVILLTAKYKVHAFFALLLACFVMGTGASMPVTEIIGVTKQGFGNILQSLGLVIVLGTTLGVVLGYSGSTQTMASFILKKVGDKNAAFAMSVTGFIVGLPIFCDSGYIVLSGLTKSLAKRTAGSIVVMSVSLATGLYSVHCLIPPHPGAAAAAGILGADFGKLIAYGIIVAIPGMLAGHWWARYSSGKAGSDAAEVIAEKTNKPAQTSVILAFLPVLVPIILIAIRSFLPPATNAAAGWQKIFYVLGDPVIALSAGVLLALAGVSWKKETLATLLQESAEKAGGILVIIGAGGAFGAVLAATKTGDHFSEAVPLASLGLLFPFLLTFILKTAQGSSTVAIITAASIVFPLLPALGLASENGKLLCMLSMGAGSMMISHANDAYFWVISKFSGIEMKTMLKCYSVATIIMGLVTLGMVYLLSFVL